MASDVGPCLRFVVHATGTEFSASSKHPRCRKLECDSSPVFKVDLKLSDFQANDGDWPAELSASPGS